LATVLSEDVKESSLAHRRARSARSRELPEADPVELGIWLNSLLSFVGSGTNTFFEAGEVSHGRELRVVHAGLQRCAMLTAMLLDPQAEAGRIRRNELQTLAITLRDLILTGDSLLLAANHGNADWRSWASTVGYRLAGAAAVRELAIIADSAGDRNLPAPLAGLLDATDLSPGHAELALILPHFGRILTSLQIISGMLERDEPLKPAMIIFSRINEQILDLITFITQRLERFPDSEGEIFSSFDAAAYTASMELKKVYGLELAAIAQLRPAPTVFARMETAHSLLFDGFEQILAGFVRLVDPSAKLYTIFPRLAAKRERSLLLRTELVTLVRSVQLAEERPDDGSIEAVRAAIGSFMQNTVGFLFFKDTETVERFVEEIEMARNGKDLVPLLHRFGAYLETLLSQVALRSVLSDGHVR
jgi:hypothetical protein